MDINAQHEILYKAYLLSRFADEIDNVIDIPILSYEEFCEELKKSKEGDIINSRS